MTNIIKQRIAALVLFLICLPGISAAADETGVFITPVPLYVEISEAGIDLTAGGSVAVGVDSNSLEQAKWISSLIRQHTGLSISPTTTAAPDALIRLQQVPTDVLTEKFEQAGLEIPVQLGDAYSLKVDPTGVLIQATDPGGLFYGMTSLWQLFTTEAGETGVLPGLEILDAPQFEWRGLMLDSARHMQSVEFIKQYLDWMSLYKLNVFHWHFTDDQAWRLEIKAYPRLAEIGGYRVPAGAAPAADIDPETGKPRLYGGYYTQEQVREIVAHASLRHITVVPEIDVPGHATAAIAAYPELGVSGHGVSQVPASWGIYNNVFNLEESTFEFLEAVLEEVVALFPGEFIHLGGDEVKTDQWKGSQRIQQRMGELGIGNLQSLQNYYVERLQTFLDPYERRVIGWDEILESELPPHAAVMSWRGVEGAINAAKKGHQTVLSPAPTMYLDHIQNLAVDAPPGRGGVTSIRDIYEFNPLPDTLGDNKELVLGLQGNLWTEHIRTPDRVEYMTWPRASAIAELGWSAPERRDWAVFATRLSTNQSRLKALGINVGGDHVAVEPQSPFKREDRELELCSNAIALALEDDAPLQGQRESFLFDIMHPCWIWRDAELTSVQSISAAVGQLPFNFEIGDDINNVKVEKPTSGHGELRVTLGAKPGQCDGPVIATLPLAPAVGNQAVTVLAGAPLLLSDGLPERGDLCFSFTRPAIDPMWAIDWVQLDQATK